MRTALFALSVASLVLPRLGWANEQIEGTASTYAALHLQATTTSTCVRASSAASSKCALFPAGEAVNAKFWNLAWMTATAPVTCCWALNLAAGVDATNAEIDADNRGACFYFPGTTAIYDDKPRYLDLLNSGGAVTGICSAAVTGATAADRWVNGAAGDVVMYPPCDDQADCRVEHAISGATCTAAGSLTEIQKANVGAYLICETPSSTSEVYVWKKKTLRLVVGPGR